MNEFDLIEAIKQKTYRQSSLIKGIGDDGAVIRELSNDLVLSVDTFVEDVHFTKETMDSFQIGYRLLTANFSDLAAMGAEPAYYLVSAVVPYEWSKNDTIELFNGMKYLASNYQSDLIGGDTVSGEKLILTITAIGRVEQKSIRYRHLAKADDVVFVTGTLGDSRAGLHLLQNNQEHEERAYFLKRHQMPEPRVKFARALGAIKRLALNDISDGIASEANEIAQASDITLLIEEKKIPIHDGLLTFSKEKQDFWKLSGGEDFELIGTVAKNEWEQVQSIAKKLQVQVTEVGKVINKAKYPVYMKRNDLYEVLEKTGYTHLK